MNFPNPFHRVDKKAQALKIDYRKRGALLFVSLVLITIILIIFFENQSLNRQLVESQARYFTSQENGVTLITGCLIDEENTCAEGTYCTYWNSDQVGVCLPDISTANQEK